MYQTTADGWFIWILYRYKHKIVQRWHFGWDSKAQSLANTQVWTEKGKDEHKQMGSYRWWEVEVTAPFIHFIPPGGSTYTPPSHKLHVLMVLRMAPASALSFTLFTRLRSAECSHFLSLSYASSLAWCCFCACTHLHLHTRKTSHPSKNILALVFNLFLPVYVMGLALFITHWQLRPSV